jgi:hypothetical protein
MNFVEKLIELKKEFHEYVCPLQQYRLKNGWDVSDEIRDSICSQCECYNAKVSIFDNEDNELKTDMCRLFELMEIGD